MCVCVHVRARARVRVQVISNFRPADTSGLSAAFKDQPNTFSYTVLKKPVSVMLRHKDGVYGIDSHQDGGHDNQILIDLGKTMQRMLSAHIYIHLCMYTHIHTHREREREREREIHTYTNTNTSIHTCMHACIYQRTDVCVVYNRQDDGTHADHV